MTLQFPSKKQCSEQYAKKIDSNEWFQNNLFNLFRRDFSQYHLDVCVVYLQNKQHKCVDDKD